MVWGGNIVKWRRGERRLEGPSIEDLGMEVILRLLEEDVLLVSGVGRIE